MKQRLLVGLFLLTTLAHIQTVSAGSQTLTTTKPVALNSQKGTFMLHSQPSETPQPFKIKTEVKRALFRGLVQQYRVL